MTAPTSALAVANFFVGKGIDLGDEVTQLKLQKLTYYAYAWWAAFDRGKLFDDPVEAWQHGPVVKKLWETFRTFGSSPINAVQSEWIWKDGKVEFQFPKVEDGDVIGFLGKVWAAYNKFSAIQLSNMTHSSDEPWCFIRQRDNLSSRPEIPFEMVRDMFKKKLSAQSSNG